MMSTNSKDDKDDARFTGIMIPMDEADNDYEEYYDEFKAEYYQYLDELYEEHVMREQYERLERRHESGNIQY